MDDVIFAGTAKRPALGRAEVSLTLDNSAGHAADRVHRGHRQPAPCSAPGDSEYAINGVACRLLDVQELLSDAGVGRQQHVIVSQGQIDAVLNARPEERRSIIEEAAGVLKFRKRKEKAERRLDATEASLLRVQDLLREVRRQLRPLERQAEAARRHGELVAELAALQSVPRRPRDRRAAPRGWSARRPSDPTAPTPRAASCAAELAALDTEVLAAEAELTARGDTDLGDELRARRAAARAGPWPRAPCSPSGARSMERDRGAADGRRCRRQPRGRGGPPARRAGRGRRRRSPRWSPPPPRSRPRRRAFAGRAGPR